MGWYFFHHEYLFIFIIIIILDIQRHLRKVIFILPFDNTKNYIYIYYFNCRNNYIISQLTWYCFDLLLTSPLYCYFSKTRLSSLFVLSFV